MDHDNEHPVVSTTCIGGEAHAFIPQFGNPNELVAYILCQKCGETRTVRWKPVAPLVKVPRLN